VTPFFHLVAGCLIFVAFDSNFYICSFRGASVVSAETTRITYAKKQRLDVFIINPLNNLF